MIIWKCDRCRKEVEEGALSRVESVLVSSGVGVPIVHGALCVECCGSLANWIKQRPAEPWRPNLQDLRTAVKDHFRSGDGVIPESLKKHF